MYVGIQNRMFHVGDVQLCHYPMHLVSQVFNLLSYFTETFCTCVCIAIIFLILWLCKLAMDQLWMVRQVTVIGSFVCVPVFEAAES